ncbi:helix-turn-helix transcriptional regulator [Ornithinimicrobium sufpigmenti]|uniref:helix-turn-helix transcriptional regulator n=1 Tax=Ornithinimicrobium sufpigmenti TaxID=2508882 RepID=UPI001036B09B|nr:MULTISPECIES: LuxR C-terminal-related transcriptional regulator [unclassified Ornithinimicrobium]
MRGNLSSESTLRVIRELLQLDGPGYALPDEFFRRLCELVDCECVRLNHLDSTAETHYFSQGYAVDEGPFLIHPVPWAPENDAWWADYWTSICSFPERSGTYHHVQLNTDFLTAQQRRAHPHTARDTPEMMLVLPDGGGRQLRLLVERDEGPGFTEDDRFLLLLLMPHLERMYRTRERQRAGSIARITPRQRELLEQLRLGLTNAQIARRLHISEGTVRTHLQHLYDRLGVTNRVAAVMLMDRLDDDAGAPVSTTMRLR